MNTQEIRDCKNFLTIKKTDYNFTLGRNIDKIYRFFDKKTDILPPTIGYTCGKQEVLEPLKGELGLTIKEKTFENKEKFKEIIKLQEEALRIIKKRNEQFNYRCGLLNLTTGAGKGHIIIDITAYYQVETLVLVHNTKTLHELIKKFEDFTNIKPSQYGDGKKEIGAITIMTKRSFVLDNEKIKHNFKLLLIDEAPVQFSKKLWESINLSFEGIKGVALYGLSGTPYKIELTQEDLEKYFGKTVEVKQKANNGYNYTPKITMYDYMVDKWVYEYENPAEMRTQVSENIPRLAEQLTRIKDLSRDRKCTLILTDRRAEVDNFYKHRHGLGFCFVIHGDTKREEDEKNIESARKMVESGIKVCIIGTIQKVGIGVDISFIDTIFLASAIKFGATVIQGIGRGLRISDGKNDVMVGVWNDVSHYKNQRYEKMKVIKSEYGILESDIKIVKINKKIGKK